MSSTHDLTKLSVKLPFKSLYYGQLGIRNKVNFSMLSYKHICIAMFERKTCVFKASPSIVSLAYKRQ